MTGKNKDKPWSRIIILAASLTGFILALYFMHRIGFHNIFSAVASIGVEGFLLFCFFSVIVLLLLGAAWFSVTPNQSLRKMPLFSWGRTIREAASEILPFSQIGGIILGARTLTGAGLPFQLVYASMIVDMTAEMASQLIFTLFGVGTISFYYFGGGKAMSIQPLSYAGLGVIVAILLLFILFQRPILNVAGSLAEKIVPGAGDNIRDVSNKMTEIYHQPMKLLASFTFNMLAWVVGASSAWVALRFMGVQVSLTAVLTIESLIFALRSAAFIVPGAIGLQEGAYILMAPLFGLTGAEMIALSLLKRARDISIGVPALLLWQINESRRLL
ncbi:putative membrane spanning protein [Zymomonas mobilis subsp. mobilis ZM4 = ATCC 31821]|uniref:Conserved hypothetical membrane spanning protein n=1 Tax=Zymomonas mobilis subsp. mobilis (strain ATCC 31821 / ZM4 / CP4) TaxID=264203 RepID=Q5NNW1_ZYMMO|nr:HpnL family protein [Zymomonas mobilis]AAV89599.1 conserved hypothetical membrane spanning protein [Zymomonas mobilis subsp. mobilis ZM4 = ATCC 31821]ACV74878.1 conserved hypothetical protein [Zymomonas mobilis subsp. mobilis NCIMB 11163]AHB09666.1 putative membrane protein [Zymomonas mobilis subsp. mobilis str. CP4 = NRRL B-14023]AHJ69971.1 putative membrane protein [Zymomonas mobilis subsp. mobilis NRRL B-12526]AHJ71826.1 putative membrane protein [Zymomonas mobilis subsp. mobilis str. CP